MRVSGAIYCVTLVVCKVTVAAAPPATLTTAEVQQRLKALDAAVHAWYVEYSDTPSASPDLCHQRIVACHWPDQFFHFNAHGAPSCMWQDDPFQQRLSINGSSAIVEHPFDRTYSVVLLPVRASLPGTAPNEPLFVALGWWGLRDRPMPMVTSNTAAPLAAIAHSSRYRLRPSKENISGQWCYVLEDAVHDRLWLDSNHGFMIVSREIYEPTTGVLVRKLVATGQIEVAPGIWAPKEIEYSRIGSGKAEGEALTLVQFRLTLLRVLINDKAPANTFSFHPMPGSIQILNDGHLGQMTRGGEQYMDWLAGWLARHRSSANLPSSDRLAAFEPVVEVTLILVSCIVLIATVARSRRHVARSARSKVVEAEMLW